MLFQNYLLLILLEMQQLEHSNKATMNQQLNSSSVNGKTVAVISYLTFIGWIIAFILHNNNRTSLGAFHLRQSGFLFIVGAVISFLSRLFVHGGLLGGLFGTIFGLLGIALFILLIIGLIRAANGEEKPLPFIGDMAQQLFAGLK